MMPNHTRGAEKAFTLIELVIVAAIIVVIATMAIPKLMAARLVANETAALTSLRALITAQALVQTQANIDSDGDGTGEDGYFAELAGTAPVRDTAGGVPVPGVHKLTPNVLSVAFGKIDGNGLVGRSGYYFQLWLPGAQVGGLTPGIGELPTAGGADPSNMPNANLCAYLWCCYAWPISAGNSGKRAFFVNQRGDLLQFNNAMANPYSGTAHMPGFDEAFATMGDMGSKTRIGTTGGHDGTTWIPIQ
jgi:prepilin-type N-terminal cleavage/methylation domain-containing protein